MLELGGKAGSPGRCWFSYLGAHERYRARTFTCCPQPAEQLQENRFCLLRDTVMYHPTSKPLRQGL